VTAPISSSRAPPAGWPTSSSRAIATSATALQESPCAPRCRLGRGAGGDGPSPADHRVGRPGRRGHHPRGRRRPVARTSAGKKGKLTPRGDQGPDIQSSLAADFTAPHVMPSRVTGAPRRARALSQAGCCRCFGGCTPRRLTAVTAAPLPMAWICVPCDDQRPSPRRHWVAGLALSGVCPRFQDRGRTADTRRAASRGGELSYRQSRRGGLFTAQRREEPPRGWRRPARRAR
jgi:hypothetical protein